MAPAGYEGASNFSFPWHFPTSSGVSLQGEKSVSSLPPPNFTVELVGLEFPGAAPATPSLGQGHCGYCSRKHTPLAYRVSCLSVRPSMGAGEQSAPD